jgi:tRNA pseudouridine32 synthase/23S rRNA pseudouridine746 synthase
MNLRYSITSILSVHLSTVMAFDAMRQRQHKRCHIDCRDQVSKSRCTRFANRLLHQSDNGILFRRRHSTKRRRVQFVPWAGKGGMLPHQYYSGVLNQDEYIPWLRISHDSNVHIADSGVQEYFSSLPINNDPSESTRIARQQLKPPPVQPKHLKPVFIDEHIIVVDKPSGVLAVPGPRRHECVASLAYRYIGKSEVNNVHDNIDTTQSDKATWKPLNDAENKQLDTMVVHRLDRDTSGVLLFARNASALKQLHHDFKDKTHQRLTKKYIALVCGHWNGNSTNLNAIAVDEGEIDLPLMRDIDHPPFMCVATAASMLKQDQLKQQSFQQSDSQSSKDQRQSHPGYLRMVGKEAKPSLTTYRILSYEYLTDTNSRNRLPVTRVELVPVTGRTHQLRVHCAALGHPIVGDSIYGYNGEGAPLGGLAVPVDKANLDLQRGIHEYWLNRQTPVNGIVDECMLCLHAHQLTISHPFTEAPMIFECHPPF